MRKGFSGPALTERGNQGKERENFESYNVGLQMSNFDGCSIRCTDYVDDSSSFFPFVNLLPASMCYFRLF